jgi:hypothetical protein
MADNTTLNAGSGGDVIASDDIGGVKFQRIKLITGNDNTNDGDVSKSNPLAIYTPTSPIINISGTITIGGTAQSLSVANTAGRYFMIQNHSTIESLWFNDFGVATAGQPSIEISAGGYYESPYSTTSAISIFALTTGHSFTAKEWLIG